MKPLTKEQMTRFKDTKPTFSGRRSPRPGFYAKIRERSIPAHVAGLWFNSGFIP